MLAFNGVLPTSMAPRGVDARPSWGHVPLVDFVHSPYLELEAKKSFGAEVRFLCHLPPFRPPFSKAKPLKMAGLLVGLQFCHLSLSTAPFF